MADHDSTPRHWLGLAGWLGITYVAATIGGAASVRASDSYQALQQPSWAPPPWLFGPVWTVLYTMMAVAAWLVWRQRGFDRARGPLIFYLVHLVLNAAWSWIFFGYGLIGWALLEVAVLWAVVATLVGLFWRKQPLAGALLIPYLLWVTFATALNASLWQLNA